MFNTYQTDIYNSWNYSFFLSCRVEFGLILVVSIHAYSIRKTLEHLRMSCVSTFGKWISPWRLCEKKIGNADFVFVIDIDNQYCWNLLRVCNVGYIILVILVISSPAAVSLLETFMREIFSTFTWKTRRWEKCKKQDVTSSSRYFVSSNWKFWLNEWILCNYKHDFHNILVCIS